MAVVVTMGTGGGVGGTDNPPSGGGSGGGNSGSVSALFAPTSNPRYQLVGAGSQSFGVLSNQEQASDGAVYKINDYALTGNDRAVLDINGDASFAIGRWHAGTLTKTGDTPRNLTGAQGSDYHYVLFNTLSAFPTSGSYNCNTGKFTAPSRVGTSGPVTGTTTGSATVSFNANGASVIGSLSATGSNSVTVSLNRNPPGPTAAAITGAYLSNGTGASVQIGDGGAGVVTIVGAYRAKMDNSTSYIGVYRLLCSAVQNS